MLEQSKQPTLQNVVPAFYLLRNVWSEKNSTDDRRVKCLKKELVVQLDDKVWSAISAVHLTATYLDPTLREFVFVPSVQDRSLFISQAKDSLMAYACDEYEKRPERYSGESNEVSLAPPAKRQKMEADVDANDALGAFRSGNNAT